MSSPKGKAYRRKWLTIFSLIFVTGMGSLLSVMWYGSRQSAISREITQSPPLGPAPTPHPTPKPSELPKGPRETDVVDSDMWPEEALANNDFPQKFLDRVEMMNVHYLGFDGKRHRGQIVVAKDVADDVKEIFTKMESLKYPRSSQSSTMAGTTKSRLTTTIRQPSTIET